jgi:hypothetical protein
MSFTLLILITLLGAVMNRIRGGWLADFIYPYPERIKLLERFKLMKEGEMVGVKMLNAAVFGIVFGLLTNPYLIPIHALVLRLAFAPGWGGYIGAILDRKIYKDRRDILILDKWFRGEKFPVFNGWAALSLRGLMLTAVLAVPFIFYTKFWFLMGLVGLTMGSCYLIPAIICEHFGNRQSGWQWGEIFFGAVLWGSYYYLLAIG